MEADRDPAGGCTCRSPALGQTSHMTEEDTGPDDVWARLRRLEDLEPRAPQFQIEAQLPAGRLEGFARRRWRMALREQRRVEGHAMQRAERGQQPRLPIVRKKVRRAAAQELVHGPGLSGREATGMDSVPSRYPAGPIIDAIFGTRIAATLRASCPQGRASAREYASSVARGRTPGISGQCVQ